MSNFKLNLPTDIPWKRICVTEDMIDKTVCDKRLPAKWQTSMAVFKYRPDDEYQLFPDYNITYLKVTATITGYQPLDKEIQGNIDWDGVDVSNVPGLTDLLNSYNPCHGAILQVAVGPKNTQGIAKKDYPFFMDFEPKKRELYELATDTKEKQSRSIESLNITKSAGTTQSTEILDVDMGGGGFGAQASYAGTGGGFNYSAPNGQWGTKRLNADESLSSRSSDVGQEKRESFSFSTQISQMYHLLDSYHLGTNRIVFFVQPRPHTLEEPSGFVRGPRPVDGIQEFFMVVAQPKNQDDFCVSLRLDTSHLTKKAIMEHDTKSVITDTAIAVADLPTKLDTQVAREVRCIVDYWLTEDDIYYKKFAKKVPGNALYDAPEGYSIDSYTNSHYVNQNGTSSVNLAANSKHLTINVEANSSVWFQDEGDGIFADCPDILDEKTGRVERRLQVNLKSDEAIKQVGEEEVLMITTRGLCCCASEIDRHESIDEFVVGIKRIPTEYAMPKDIAKSSYQRANNLSVAMAASYAKHTDTTHDEGCKDCQDKTNNNNHQVMDTKYAIRQANELSNYIKTEAIKSLNDPTLKPKKFIETDFFAKEMRSKMVQYKKGRSILQKPVLESLSSKSVSKLEKHFQKPAKEIKRKDILSLGNRSLEKIIGIKSDEIQKLKLESLGIGLKKEAIQKPTKRSKKGGTDYKTKS